MEAVATEIDIAIVGGGIVGLWSAYELLKQYPKLNLVVFEAENFLGEHTTGRNSEVLHSGIYYETNSLKHIHCIHGNTLWREYLGKNSAHLVSCGKVIVATKGQEEKLENLRKKATTNQVSGLRDLTTAEIKNLDKIVNIKTGFFVESAGVLNVSECLTRLETDIESMGGIILKNSSVRIENFNDQGFQLKVNGDSILSRQLVNACGLFAIDFRKALGLGNFENYYVKGAYLKLRKKMDSKNLIYPIPPADGLGLGVHLTLDAVGDQKFGPNTWAVDDINYAIDDSLLLQMTPSIHEIFKNIKDEDLQLGYSGIRPKVKKNGKLQTDFIFQTEKDHQIKGYYEFLGIESPGLTAAPSLAKMLAQTVSI